MFTLIACGGRQQSSAVAANVRATSCNGTNIKILSPIDHSQQRLYDCRMATGTFKCFIDEGGAVRDVTEEARSWLPLASASPAGALVRLPKCAGHPR